MPLVLKLSGTAAQQTATQPTAAQQNATQPAAAQLNATQPTAAQQNATQPTAEQLELAPVSAAMKTLERLVCTGKGTFLVGGGPFVHVCVDASGRLGRWVFQSGPFDTTLDEGTGFFRVCVRGGAESPARVALLKNVAAVLATCAISSGGRLFSGHRQLDSKTGSASSGWALLGAPDDGAKDAFVCTVFHYRNLCSSPHSPRDLRALSQERYFGCCADLIDALATQPDRLVSFVAAQMSRACGGLAPSLACDSLACGGLAPQLEQQLCAAAYLWVRTIAPLAAGVFSAGHRSSSTREVL